MAAALRYAAKRLGSGVLQRSKPAIVSEEGWRLPTRLLHTPTRAATVDDGRIAAIRLSQIQEKREELYDLVADFERTYKAPMAISWENGALLHRLSTQIEPRPSDPYWRMCRRGQRKTTFYTVVGIVSAGTSIGGALGYGLLWLKKSYAKELEVWWKKSYAKELQDWWNKQMRSTRAK